MPYTEIIVLGIKGEAESKADTLDLVLEADAQTVEYGKDGSKGGNVAFEWKIEEGDHFVGDPAIELTGDRGAGDVGGDDVYVDGNIVTAQEFDGW